MPLARNAIVGLPMPSSASSRGASSSASRDSLSPQVRSVRLTIVWRTPALYNLVQLLWLKLQVLVGMDT